MEMIRVRIRLGNPQKECSIWVWPNEVAVCENYLYIKNGAELIHLEDTQKLVQRITDHVPMRGIKAQWLSGKKTTVWVGTCGYCILDDKLYFAGKTAPWLCEESAFVGSSTRVDSERHIEKWECHECALPCKVEIHVDPKYLGEYVANKDLGEHRFQSRQCLCLGKERDSDWQENLELEELVFDAGEGSLSSKSEGRVLGLVDATEVVEIKFPNFESSFVVGPIAAEDEAAVQEILNSMTHGFDAGYHPDEYNKANKVREILAKYPNIKPRKVSKA